VEKNSDYLRVRKPKIFFILKFLDVVLNFYRYPLPNLIVLEQQSIFLELME
jgi:hypothetical protein